MSKYKGNIQKGSLVYARQTYGTNAGQVDEDQLYRVRQIGPKMCTLERVNKETGQPEQSRWNGKVRGHNYYLHTQEEVERANSQARNGGWRSFYYWDWSQFLVPVGNAGWDPDMNF